MRVEDGIVFITSEEYARLNEDSVGVCIGCGMEADGCEPDTRERECEACSQNKVYGLEELMIMNLIQLEDPDDGDEEER
jgi:hypothetical protein